MAKAPSPLPEDTQIPSGPQNIAIFNDQQGSDTLVIPGCTGAPFDVFFVYEISGSPSQVTLRFNGGTFPISPGQYSLHVQSQLDVEIRPVLSGSTKLVWIYT